MTARTPGPWTVVPSAVSQRFDLRNESTGLIWNRALKNSAACELAATKNAHDALTARCKALEEALAGIMKRVDAAMAQGDEPGKGVAELLTAARAALAKGGGGQ